MNPLSRFFDAPISSALGAMENIRRTFSNNKAADCVFIIGPDNANDVEELSWKAYKEGLNAVFIGDGRTSVTKEMIQRAREEGIIGDRTEVICLMHGLSVTDPSDKAQKHVMYIGDTVNNNGNKVKELISTRKLIQYIRSPIRKNNQADQSEVWQGNIHIGACRIGALKSEYLQSGKGDDDNKKINTSSWEKGNVLLYGSSKILSGYAAAHNFDLLLEHLGSRKRERASDIQSMNNQANTIADTFDAIRKNSVETLVWLNGDASLMSISRSPKKLADVLQGRIIEIAAQQRAHAKLQENLGSKKISLFGRSSKKIFNPDKYLSPDERGKITSFIFTRLAHLKSQKKLLLMNAELSENPWLANVKTPTGMTPLHYIAKRLMPYENSAITFAQVAENLINAGADVNARDKWGDTPLTLAAKAGNAEIVTLLLKKLHSDTQLNDGHLMNSLYLACKARRNSSETVQAVLTKIAEFPEKKSLINRRDDQGHTALHLAVMAGDMKTVEILLKSGADPAQRTYGFSTPGDLARKLAPEVSQQILQLLREAKVKKTNAPN